MSWKSLVWGLGTALLLVPACSFTLPWNSEQQQHAIQKFSVKKPNIVFILTDDQDVRMNSLLYMPLLQKYLVDEGTVFEKHYCTIALCCPSRVSLWTGKAAHNTNVTDVNPPYGGYPKFVSQGLNEAWLPVWLQEAGYNTYYTGKLFNAHTVNNYNSPYPKGFTHSDFLLDPYTYQYLNATFQRDTNAPVSHEGEYSTDVIAKKAYGFLDNAVQADNPFFLTIATNAPHSNVEFRESFFGPNPTASDIKLTPPISATRHEHLFEGVVVPRTANFNPDQAGSVSWLAQLPKQNQTVVDANDHFYRQRLRALQAVDELIDGVITRLSNAGVLEDTYVVYSSDNGYHIGQHRLQPGKECGFEEDINVPLVVRGPGVARGKVSDLVTSHTDLAPTFLSLIGAHLDHEFDGSVIPFAEEEEDSGAKEMCRESDRREHVGIEYWGFALGEGEYDQGFYWNNTYKGLRLIGEDYNLYYSVWCSGEHELYNLQDDPYEVTNLYTSNHTQEFTFAHTHPHSTLASKPTTLQHLLARLDALVLVLKTCKQRQCTHPWEVLHPDGDVRSLHDALHTRYDRFYEYEQDRVQFTKCEQGYILESEGPNRVKAYTLQEIGARGGAMWAELV